jgi:hypothetical protein
MQLVFFSKAGLGDFGRDHVSFQVVREARPISPEGWSGVGESPAMRRMIEVPVRREADYFGDREMDLVYIAKKLQEALRLESALTGSGVEYAVETDKYSGGVIFRSERVGAFFYVLPEAADEARRVMREHGFRLHEWREEAGSIGRPEE